MQFAVIVAALIAASASPDAVVKTARRLVGQRYVYGGVGVDGFDCSGLVQVVFRRHGITLPRSSRDQAAIGKPVPLSRLRAGDLLFFTDAPGGLAVTHVGIATDAEHMVHASTGRAKVVIDRIDVRHYRERFLFARRLLPMKDRQGVAAARTRSASDRRK